MSERVILAIICISLAFLLIKLAATNRRIDLLFKSMLNHEEVLTKIMNVYVCDPDKNTQCSKTDCYIHGGRCQMTAHKEFVRTGANDSDDGK